MRGGGGKINPWRTPPPPPPPPGGRGGGFGNGKGEGVTAQTAGDEWRSGLRCSPPYSYREATFTSVESVKLRSPKA
jgi:hypothetical protein